MSIAVMTDVWRHSRHSGSHLLMMLALADFSDDQGSSYPSVPKLATKCRMKPRNANVVLAALRDSGELEIRMNEGPKGTNRYRIVLKALGGVQSNAGMQGLAGVQSNAGDASGDTLQGLVGTPAKACSKPLQGLADEPSLNRQEPSKGVRARKKAKPKTELPANFEVTERVKVWATGKGYADLDQHLETFKSKATAKGYTYVNWDEAFMGAIRDDWAGLRRGSRGASKAHIPQNALFGATNYTEEA